MNQNQRRDPTRWPTSHQGDKIHRRPYPELAASTTKRPRLQDHTHNHKTHDGEVKKDLMCLWKRSISEDFPRRHHTAYLVPPVPFFRVSYELKTIAGQPVNVHTPTTQQSDVREKEAHLRVTQAFLSLFQKHQQPLFVILGLVFDNYLNYSGAYENPRKDPKDTVGGSSQRNGFPEDGVYRSNYAVFPRPRDLHTELQRGTYDILIISKTHGLVICEIKAIGDFFGVPSAKMTKNDEKNIVRKRLAKALIQLDKERKVLRHLISDIAELKPDVAIMTTLILPNLERKTLEDVLRDDKELTKKFRQCLHADTVEAAMNRCLFSHNFPPVGKAWEVDELMISSLEQWWREITGKTGKPQMDDEAYDSLVARFCGPATSLHVQTAHQPRAEVKTLVGAVTETARCLDACTLYPEQADFVQTNAKLAFLTGPPGTGKTEMLELKAMRWIEEGHVVYVISLWQGSEAVSRRIYKRIQDKLALKASTDEARLAAAKTVKLVNHKEGLKTLLEELQTSSHQATSGKGATPTGVHENGKKSLHLIVDEAPWFFEQFFQLLKSKTSTVELYIWAASVFYGSRPKLFEEVKLVRPLRCPPSVLRELETGPAYSTRAMYPYATMDTGILSSLPPPTDGPPVKRVIHGGPGHTAGDVWECVECGKLVAKFLKEDLGIGKTDSLLRPQRALQYSDVIISGYVKLPKDETPSMVNVECADNDPATPTDVPMQNGTSEDHEEAMDMNATSNSCTGFLEGLKDENVPFDVITEVDHARAEELALPKKNMVQVSAPESIIGLERPVVVLIGTNDMNATVPQYVDPWCDVIARCLSQLVIVSGPDSAVEDWVGIKNLKLV